MIEDKWKCLMILMKIGVAIDDHWIVLGIFLCKYNAFFHGEIMNPFKPNSSRVDKLENQIINLRERVATLERDLHFFMRHYEESND